MTKKTPLVTETVNFTLELLAFQSRHLNGAHSISVVKLLCACNVIEITLGLIF